MGRLSPDTAAGLSLAWRAAVGSRVIVWAAGLAALIYLGENIAAFINLDPRGMSAPFASIPLDKLIAPAARWDSVWYLEIARFGYFSRASSNFFPLYPLLVHLGSLLLRQPLIVGLLISVGAMLGALTMLYRLALLDLDEPAARLTVLLVALFPTSLFLSAVYTESLFLLLSVAAVFAARRDRWALASVCGGLAAAERSNGVLLVVPLALIYLYGPRPRPVRSRGHELRPASPGPWWRPRHRLEPSAGWLLLVPIGLLSYLAYLWATHDAPLAPFTSSQAYWGHWFAGPLGAVVVALERLPHDLSGVLSGSAHPLGPGDPMSWSAHDLVDLGFLAAAVGALAASWRRLPFAYTAYALAMLAEILSVPTKLEPLESFSRYMLPLFPLFMGAAGWLSGHRRTTALVLGCSAATLAAFSVLWATWGWVA